MESSTIIERIQNQDPSAFDELLHEHGQRLLRVAFCLCRNETDAEDILQETFFQAFRSGPKFRGESAVYTWLYGIMFFTHRNRLRKKMNEPSFIDVEQVELEAEPRQGMTKIEVIEKEIARLSKEYRDILKLRYFKNMTIEEISKKLGISSGTVKSRLHHARKKLSNRQNLLDLMRL